MDNGAHEGDQRRGKHRGFVLGLCYYTHWLLTHSLAYLRALSITYLLFIYIHSLNYAFTYSHTYLLTYCLGHKKTMEEIRIELIEFLGEKEAKDLVLHLAKYLKDMNKSNKKVDESSNNNNKNVTRTGDVASGLKAERSTGTKNKPNNNNNNNNSNNSSINNRGAAGYKSSRSTIDDEDLEDFKRRRIGDGNTKKKGQSSKEEADSSVQNKTVAAMPLPMALPGVGVDPEVYRQQMNTLAQMQGFENVEDMVAFQKQSLLMMQRTLGTSGRGGRAGGRIYSRGGRGEYGGRGRGRGRGFVAPIKKEDAEYTRPPTVEHGLSATRAVVYKRNTDFNVE